MKLGSTTTDRDQQALEADSIGGSDIGSLRRELRSLVFGTALQATVVAVCACLQVRANEPWALRWLRTLADHPYRGTLATTLLLIALSPSLRRSAPEPQPPRL